MKLSAEARGIIEKLNENGFEAWAVGGCVRDFLIGRQISDYDITTDALPEEIMRIFPHHRVTERSLAHGTVTVTDGGDAFEVTTFRVDGNYSDSRRADSVLFTRSVEEDLARRDFTMNAVAFSPKKSFIDPFGGIEDIKNKKIKAVGDPEKRFSEDALRILRGVRFASVLGFEIEPLTAAAMSKNKGALKNISRERTAAELRAVISGEFAPRVIALYIDIIGEIIPELLCLKDFAQHSPYHDKDVLSHSLAALAFCKDDFILRTAALFHDIAKPRCFSLDENGIGHFYSHANIGEKMAEDILKRLCVGADTEKKITTLIKYHDVQIENNEKTVKRWLSRLGEEQFSRLVELKKADNAAGHPDFAYRAEKTEELAKTAKAIIEKGKCFSPRDIDINGHELIAVGIPKGPVLGKILETLFEEVLSDITPNEKEKLILRAKELFYKN